MENKEVIAYMPTWRGSNRSADSEGQVKIVKEKLEIIDANLQENECFFVNLHFLVSSALDFSSFKHIQPFPKEYADFVSFLETANELRRVLRHKRDLAGAIDFDTKEAKVVLNEKGKVKDIVLRERGDAEKLIEEMMLVANETVAQHMRWLELPYIYRIHEKPMVKKLQKLLMENRNLVLQYLLLFMNAKNVNKCKYCYKSNV